MRLVNTTCPQGADANTPDRETWLCGGEEQRGVNIAQPECIAPGDSCWKLWQATDEIRYVHERDDRPGDEVPSFADHHRNHRLDIKDIDGVVVRPEQTTHSPSTTMAVSAAFILSSFTRVNSQTTHDCSAVARGGCCSQPQP